MDLLLDLDLSTHRRARLEQALRDAIRAGRLAAGARLPSSRTLAGQLGIARGTVTAAYEQLVAEGYLTANHGSSTTVAHLVPQATNAGAASAKPPVPRHDLRPGRPDVSRFPSAAWLRATRRVLTSSPPEIFTLADPRGRIELRTALAQYLARTRGVVADPDAIVITSGYSQALSLLCGVLRDAGTTAVAMEDPGHFFHRRVVEHAHLSVVALPVDGYGARTGLLGDAGAVVLTPAHQYPTGVTLHPARRHAAIDWARRTGGLVVEDDYDGEFRYDRQPVGALQGTAPRHVAYVGTASKTLSPALRLGWMVLPAQYVEPVVEAKLRADTHTESLGQLVLADLITSYFYDRHIRGSRLRYQRRRDLLVEHVRRETPYVDVHGMAAGLHALLTLPAGLAEPAVLSAASAQGLVLDHLTRHYHNPGTRPHGLIAGYSTPTDTGYPTALRALTTAIRDARGSRGSTP